MGQTEEGEERMYSFCIKLVHFFPVETPERQWFVSPGFWMPLCLTAMAGWALGEFVHVYANWAAFYFGEKKELWYQETESTGINLHQLKQCFQVPRIFLSDVIVHHHPIIGYMFWLQWREAPFSNASFIYFWLHWVFAAVCRLLVAARGSSLKLRCSGFSCYRAPVLGAWASAVEAQGL